MNKYYIASAPAKLILFGEHSVVYSKPAIAAAINLRAKSIVRVTNSHEIEIFSKNYNSKISFNLKNITEESLIKKIGNPTLLPVCYATLKTLNYLGEQKGLSIVIDSQIPPSAGLGSSAAVSVSTIKAISIALNYNLSNDIISSLAFNAEKIVHGTPSGIDNTVSTYGGLIYFKKPDTLRRLPLSVELPIVIGNTNISRQTKTLVARVRSLLEKYPSVINRILDAMAVLVELALSALQENRTEDIGSLMNINHGLLTSIGVSHKKLDLLVYSALSAGALGAKLTGAGGGGCMFALSNKTNLNAVADAIKSTGGTPYVTSLTSKGVALEDS